MTKPDHLRAEMAAQNLASACAMLRALTIASLEDRYAFRMSVDDAQKSLAKAAEAFGYTLAPIAEKAPEAAK